jgi:hypothetical protein
MLKVIGTVAILLLIAREFLALETGPAPRSTARLVGWGAIPFVFLFAILLTLRVLAFLGNP